MPTRPCTCTSPSPPLTPCARLQVLSLYLSRHCGTWLCAKSRPGDASHVCVTHCVRFVLTSIVFDCIFLWNLVYNATHHKSPRLPVIVFWYNRQQMLCFYFFVTHPLTNSMDYTVCRHSHIVTQDIGAGAAEQTCPSSRSSSYCMIMSLSSSISRISSVCIN